MAPILTLLTDFGYQDGYVGVMKGIIASIWPRAQLIDLTHAIPPQNIAAARFTLLNAYAYFPADTIHLVVVDPGVGTDRRAIALQTDQGYFVGPDNGVLSGVLEQVEAIAAVVLDQPQYWRTTEPSATFHGRDIFAPVAAHLAAGAKLGEVGTPIAPKSLLRLAVPPPKVDENQITGSVQHIDQFGNIITTISANIVQDGGWQMRVGEVAVIFGRTYGDVTLGHAIALIGSHGWVELAVNGSSAQARFRLMMGDEVRLVKT